MNSLNEYFWFSFEWINSLNEYFRRTIEWIIEWIRKVRYSYEKWTKSAFFGRNGPLLPVFHCFLKLWFVFQFEWIILLNEYFWFNFEWIILLNEYSWFNFELNIELNHFLARFNVKMNNQNLSATPSPSWAVPGRWSSQMKAVWDLLTLNITIPFHRSGLVLWQYLTSAVRCWFFCHAKAWAGFPL